MGALTRYMRSGMLDVMSSDYVRTAQAKGLPYRTVVARHAVKNAMLSVVTVIALDLGALLAGALVTETVFQWPGSRTAIGERRSRRGTMRDRSDDRPRHLRLVYIGEPSCRHSVWIS